MKYILLVFSVCLLWTGAVSVSLATSVSAVAQAIITPGNVSNPSILSIALTGSNCTSNQCGFTPNASGTIGTAAATMSSGSFTGTYAMVTSGTDHNGTSCGNYSALSINSSTGAMPFTSSTPGALYTNFCVQASQGGSSLIQAFSAYGGWFVATSGGGAGTFSSPYTTLGACQTAMQGSSTNKTCFVRSGTYSPGSGFSTVTTSGVTSVLYLSSSDNNEMWSYYPPDSVNSPIISMGGSDTVATCTNGSLEYGFWIDGGSSITINGFTIHLGGLTAVAVHGGNLFTGIGGGLFPLNVGSAGSNTVSNNIIYGMHGSSSCYNQLFTGSSCTAPCGTGPRAAINAEVQVPNFTATHNVVHDVDGPGISTVAQSDNVTGANVAGTLFTYNAVYNTCGVDTDCGAIGGFYDPGLSCTLSAGSCYTIKYNYVRDACIASGNTAGEMLYLDDGTSGLLATGNVFAGNCSQGFQLHGGENDQLNGNIWDTGGYPYPQSFNNYFGVIVPDNTTTMSGNQFENNILVWYTGSGGATGGIHMTANGGNPGCPGSTAGATNTCVLMTETNNLYQNYGSGSSAAPAWQCDSGVTTCGAPANTNTSNPSITTNNWCYELSTSSAAYDSNTSPAVNFPVEASNWGKPGFWGPPGFSIPQTGNHPSYNSTFSGSC